MDIKRLKIILFILFLMFIATGFFALKYKSDIDAKRFYKQGESFYSKGNYSDAYYNFKQINRMSELYTLSLLKQYLCAYKLDDKKTAHSKILELVKTTNDNNIRPYAMYNEAILAMELKLNTPDRSLKKFRKITEKYPDNDFGYASSYKAGALSTDKYFKKDKYIQYLEYAPIGKFSTLALEDLNNSKDILLNSDKEIVADSYYLNSKYEDALKYYLDTDFSKNWFKISKCYRALNRKEEERATITNGLNLEKSEVEETDIDSALNRLITLTGENKIQFLQNLYLKSSSNYIYPTVIYNLAEATNSIRTIKLYEEIVKNYPSSSWASNSLWEIFWYNYSQGRFETCIKLAKIHQSKYPKSADAPRIAYWGARAMLKEKRNQEAREFLYRIKKDYPLSYYAFLSAKRLKISQAKKIIVKKPISKFDFNSLNKFVFNDDKSLLFLADNNDFETIDELKINNEYIKSWIMYKKENYPNAINTAKNEYLKKIAEDNEFKPSYSDKELKLIYPILYNEEINQYAQEFKQSPYLFLSLVREESHFNKNAKSSAGAIGLVQLMPATANFIEGGALDGEIIKQDNIRIGLKYYKYLTDMFNDNDYLAILSYNAGPGNIKKWLNDPFIKSDEIDEFVENIPYLETKNYIKKILSSYWIYFNVYK